MAKRNAKRRNNRERRQLRRARRKAYKRLDLEAAVRLGRTDDLGTRLRLLVTRGGPRCSTTVSAALSAASDDVAEVIILALAGFQNPVVEPVCIDTLEHRLRTVQLDAAAALGRAGSVHAVAPLGAWAARHPFDRGIQRAVRHAIAEIQSRLEGASPGELSLAGTDGGHVSLVEEDRRGEVSLEADQEARRS